MMDMVTLRKGLDDLLGLDFTFLHLFRVFFSYISAVPRRWVYKPNMTLAPQ